MSPVPIVFGPVPSRRLGQSLGINHIPPKSCSYDCVYCQVGPTRAPGGERRAFLRPEAVIQAVRERVATLRATDQRIDYLTFVPDGEPTLDVGLGAMIEGLRSLEIPIAVISNASLVDRPAVREVLAGADRVSLKVDAVREATWRRVNRPAPGLGLAAILEGVQAFAASYQGMLETETMLVAGLNDGREDLEATADFLAGLGPARVWLGIPTRPPSESWVEPPDDVGILRAWQVFVERVPCVDLLTGYSEDTYGRSGDPEADLIAITAVHPMRAEEILRFVEGDQALVDRLVQEGILERIEHRGKAFYVRSRGSREVRSAS